MSHGHGLTNAEVVELTKSSRARQGLPSVVTDDRVLTYVRQWLGGQPDSESHREERRQARLAEETARRTARREKTEAIAAAKRQEDQATVIAYWERICPEHVDFLKTMRGWATVAPTEEGEPGE